jgi:hypothetical protein
MTQEMPRLGDETEGTVTFGCNMCSWTSSVSISKGFVPGSQADQLLSQIMEMGFDGHNDKKHAGLAEMTAGVFKASDLPAKQS